MINFDDGGNVFNDAKFVTELALGSPLPENEADRLRRSREALAGKEITALAIDNREYARRQGDDNMTFVYSVLQELPGFKVKTLVDGDGYVSSRQELAEPVGYAYYENLDNARIGSQELKDQLSAVSSMRAAVIWVKRNSDNLFQTRIRGEEEYGFFRGASGKELDTVVPYTIIGSKPNSMAKSKRQSSNITDVLLLPLLDLTGSRETEQGIVIPVKTHNKYRSLPGEYGEKKDIELTIHKNVVRAQMSNNQYARLCNLQLSLFESGLSEDELENIYNTVTGQVTLEYGLSSIRARDRKRLPRNDKNSPHYRVGHDEPFDIVVGESITGVIHPNDFIRYSVSENLERVAIMLDAEDGFIKARKQAEKNLLEDPEIKLLQGK